MEPPPENENENSQEWHVIEIPVKFESIMQFKQSSFRAGPDVRTKWGVFLVGSPPMRALREVLPDTPEGNRYRTLLRKLRHQNILHWLWPWVADQHLGEDGQTLYSIYVRYVEGTLYDFCGSKSSCLVGVGNLVPSSLLVQIVRDIIDGLSYMHEEGEYHGNISIGTMFYYRCSDGEICVQLANFGCKEVPLGESQRDDWHDFGKMLLEIEREVSAYNSCHTSILVDLANLFINATEEEFIYFGYCLIFAPVEYCLNTLRTCSDLSLLMNTSAPVGFPRERINRKDIKEKAYKHTFFSDARDRLLLTYAVSPALDEPEFCMLLGENSSKICRIPWGCEDYYALLPAVNQARCEDFQQKPYKEEDFTDVVKFIGFICDLYEYCRRIDMPEGGTKYTVAQMDEFVVSKHPRLHHELNKLVMEFASSGV